MPAGNGGSIIARRCTANLDPKDRAGTILMDTFREYSKFLGFIPKPWLRYELGGGNLTITKGIVVKNTEEVPLSSITASKVRSSPVGWILGVRSLSLETHGQSSFVIDSIRGYREALRLLKGADDLGRPQEASATAQTNVVDRQSIPEGVIFGTKVLLMPQLSAVFDTPIWYQHCNSREHPNWRVKAGDWVGRRDQLLSLLAKRSSLFGEDKRAFVVSPVSGLVIFTAQQIGGTIFDDKFNVARSWIAILLPEQEPAPLPGKKAFAHLCETCSEYRESIYQKQGTRGWDDRSDTGLEREFNKQLSQEPSTIDLLDVRNDEEEGYFYHYINLLRSERSDLVRHLQHIGKAPVNRAAPEPERSEAELKRNEAGTADIGGNKLREVEAALKFMGLGALPATRTELKAKFLEIRETLPSEFWPELKRHYEILRSAVA